MDTTTLLRPATARDTPPVDRRSTLRRFFGVALQPRTYRSIAYLLLGLPLGTAWFTVVTTGVSVGISMLAVALLGIPLLLALWYLTRAFANVERTATNVLLDERLVLAPVAPPARGNLWVRLRAFSSERDRWRELAYLMLRFPAGIATFTVTVAALATPVLVAYAPFSARYGAAQPFGDWALSTTMEDIASSSPWSWFLIPLGVVLLIVALHALNTLASACGRWSTAWLQVEKGSLGAS